MAVDRRLFLQLHRVNRVVSAHVNRRLLEVLGVSSAQLGTLYHLARQPGCSATDLAGALDLNKSAVSTMLQRLERAGLIAQTPNPRDARGSCLSLTAKGETVRTQSVALTRKLQAEITQGFDEAELDTVARFFGSIIERFGRDSVKGDAE
ncbi:MAG: MarR family transcriptional regulator [Myxococcales bacterium]|nr:MAG: MarR family transcriptional regulator [Myxococcales bacterium]